MNPFIKYYGEHQISPVAQDISNIAIHFQKREKLYRQLGMPPVLFRNKNILEVGPGSGYNTLAFFRWLTTHASHAGGVDLIEPNPTGVKEMKKLFSEMKVSSSLYTIYENTFEKFQAVHKYDIIIAEGFLHAVDNAKEILEKLKTLCNSGGVIVITCMDEMSMFVEQMKRFIGLYMCKEIPDYDGKVKFCTKLFEASFSKLNGMSRCVEDWVKDDILNPAFCNAVYLDIQSAIEDFGKDFYVLGSSQKIFTDYSWYKDLSYDENRNCIIQFRKKQHIFFMAGLEEAELNCEESSFLREKILDIRHACIMSETEGTNMIGHISEALESIKNICKKIHVKLYGFVENCIAILKKLELGEEKFELGDYPDFFYAVGRTQQYLSMVKKFDY